MNHQAFRPGDGGSDFGAPRDRSLLIVGLSILAMFIVIGGLVVMIRAHANAVYGEFMEGCEQDHKHYECMLMWRASSRDDPTIVPMPIIVPTGR